MTRLPGILMWFVLTAWLMGSASFVEGQSGTGQSDQPKTSAPRTMSNTHQIVITGCLKRGSGQNQFYLTDQDGRTWTLVSQSVNLAEQVFHSVTVAGKETMDSGQQQSPGKAGETAKAPDTMHYILKVLTLEVLSRSCTR